VFVEGGIYHVYNRVTRGEHVFAEDAEAERLLDAMRDSKKRDKFIVLAWCIMSNHYHLAIRSTSVPLWRSMASIHSKVSKSYNRRHRVFGPFWQGRYKAKLISDPKHLRALPLYIHLNPVTAGIVEKAEDFMWAGHRELVRKIRRPFVDPDQFLLVFGETRQNARKTYLQSLRAAKSDSWNDAGPGELPWWRFGRAPTENPDDDLTIGRSTPFIDELGRSTGRERPFLTAQDYLRRLLDLLEVNLDDVAGRTKRQEVVRAREIIMTLAIERYDLRLTDLAALSGVRYDAASLWGRRGAQRRVTDPDFRRRIEEIDNALLATQPSREDALPDLERPNV
jgi:REP element-mobilizing transposase RayT